MGLLGVTGRLGHHGGSLHMNNHIYNLSCYNLLKCEVIGSSSMDDRKLFSRFLKTMVEQEEEFLMCIGKQLKSLYI